MERRHVERIAFSVFAQAQKSKARSPPQVHFPRYLFPPSLPPFCPFSPRTGRKAFALFFEAGREWQGGGGCLFEIWHRGGPCHDAAHSYAGSIVSGCSCLAITWRKKEGVALTQKRRAKGSQASFSCFPFLQPDDECFSILGRFLACFEMRVADVLTRSQCPHTTHTTHPTQPQPATSRSAYIIA